jgi:FkbM family methyltransferase
MPQSIISDVQAWMIRKQTAFLPDDSLRARLVVGVFWSMAGTVITQVLQLAAIIFVARWLGKAKYGEIGIVQSTVGMLGVFVGLGLGLTAVKYVSELRNRDPARASRIASLTIIMALISGTLISAALIPASPWLASHTLGLPAVSRPLAIGAGLLFFGEVNGVQGGILSGLEAFNALARVSLWAGLCSVPITISATWLGGVNGAVVGLVVSAALNCVLTHLALRHEASQAGINFSHLGTWEERSVLWNFSLPAFLAGAAVTPATWACDALLVNQPRGYAQMGLFSAADQWRTAILFLPGIVSRVVLPILSSHSNESAEDDSHFSSTLEAGYAVGVLVAFPLVTALSFGGSLLAKAYGPDFAGMRYPLAGLLYAGGVLAIGSPVGSAVQAKGAMWLAALNNLTWSTALVVSFHFLIGRGATGLAMAYSLSYLLLSLTFLWVFCQKGYFPWHLGLRTGLADLSLVVFAFLPLFVSVNLSLWLMPLALPISLAAVWVFLPRRLRSRLVESAYERLYFVQYFREKGRARANPGNTFSTHGDEWVIQKHVGSVKSFIDIGAGNGIAGSNTLYFALRGASGICFEPLKESYDKLRCLYLLNRRVVCRNCGISDKSGEASIVQLQDCSYLSETEDEAHTRLLPIERLRGSELLGRVKLLTFDEATKGITLPNIIDLLDIDVEGHELNVLRSVPFDRYGFGIIMLETHLMDETGQYIWKHRDLDEMNKLLADHGYHPVDMTRANTFYARHPKYLDFGQRFKCRDRVPGTSDQGSFRRS